MTIINVKCINYRYEVIKLFSNDEKNAKLFILNRSQKIDNTHISCIYINKYVKVKNTQAALFMKCRKKLKHQKKRRQSKKQ